MALPDLTSLVSSCNGLRCAASHQAKFGGEHSGRHSGKHSGSSGEGENEGEDGENTRAGNTGNEVSEPGTGEPFTSLREGGSGTTVYHR